VLGELPENTDSGSTPRRAKSVKLEPSPEIYKSLKFLSKCAHAETLRAMNCDLQESELDPLFRFQTHINQFDL
jgi:hypothetical protein